MFELQDNNKILLTRGDSLYLTFEITEDGEPYAVQPGDTVRFAMKQKYTDEECLIMKNLYADTSGNMVLHLLPEDTKNLEYKKDYFYDVQLTTADGDVYTFVSGKFRLTEEVE